MIRLITLFAIAVLFVTVPAHADEHDWQPLLAGNDLSGWEVPENNIWWEIEDGILKVKSGPKRKGSDLWTEKEYENFVVDFEFRFGEGTVDSGIFLRDKRQQIQIGISGSLKRDMTASPYIAGKGYPVEAKGVDKLLKQEGWNQMKIKAEGPIYTVWLNGEQVMTYESDNAKQRGPIGIQLHGGRGMAIDYRNMRVAEME